MKHLSALFILLTVACMQRAAVEPATIVLRNGKIVTVDDAKPEAQAIAIDGDRIAAVGSNDDGGRGAYRQDA